MECGWRQNKQATKVKSREPRAGRASVIVFFIVDKPACQKSGKKIKKNIANPPRR